MKLKENLLWHLFGLVPYIFRSKGWTIKFYGTIEECQKLDRYLSKFSGYK